MINREINLEEFFESIDYLKETIIIFLIGILFILIIYLFIIKDILFLITSLAVGIISLIFIIYCYFIEDEN